MSDTRITHNPSLARLLVQSPDRRQALAVYRATEFRNPTSRMRPAGLSGFVCLLCLQCLFRLSGAA